MNGEAYGVSLFIERRYIFMKKNKKFLYLLFLQFKDPSIRRPIILNNCVLGLAIKGILRQDFWNMDWGRHYPDRNILQTEGSSGIIRNRIEEPRIKSSLKIASCELRAADWELRVADCELRASWEPKAKGWELTIEN